LICIKTLPFCAAYHVHRELGMDVPVYVLDQSRIVFG
jgi:hypothetical protein